MNRYFKLVCTHENPDWYMQEFLCGRTRFGWSGPGCDLREIRGKDWATWSDDQRVTWRYTQFLVERLVPGDRVVVQPEQPLRRFVVAEVVPPGYDYVPGDLPDFNHLLHIRVLTPTPIPVNSSAISAALKHDLSKRGNYYEIYPEESIRELDVLVDQVAANKADLTVKRTDADTLDDTLRGTKSHIIREVSRKWPGKDFERFCEKLLRKVDHIEVKELGDSGKGWDLLVRIINPLTQTILLDDVPVQCKNFTGDVTTLGPINDLERCIRNSKSRVAYLFILGRLSKEFLEALQNRQETLQKELGQPVSFEVVGEDRIAEIYAANLNSGLSESPGAVQRANRDRPQKWREFGHRRRRKPLPKPLDSDILSPIITTISPRPALRFLRSPPTIRLPARPPCPSRFVPSVALIIMDTNQDPTIFEAYKPLRNGIRKLGLADSLAVIRAYMSNLQFNQNIPSDCEVHPDYYSRSAAWVAEFHLETICREVVLHAKEFGRTDDTLKDWKTLARTVNRLKNLEEMIAARHRSPDLLMQELHRMAHRQFPWQAFRPNAVNITRYHMIYGHPPLAGIIKTATGLSPEELFLYGMALLGVFMGTFAQVCPPNIQIPGLSSEGLDRFLRHFSRNLPELKMLLQDEHQMNERFAYAYNSLRAFPLIGIKFQGKDHLVCPIPTLLFWRFTNGVYYEIFSQSGFENAFGEAFQWYVGQVVKNGTTKDKTQIYPECEYRVGKDSKRTVDWIVDQGIAALFVEAKTKRALPGSPWVG